MLNQLKFFVPFSFLRQAQGLSVKSLLGRNLACAPAFHSDTLRGLHFRFAPAFYF
jgi:hypothetical protein